MPLAPCSIAIVPSSWSNRKEEEEERTSQENDDDDDDDDRLRGHATSSLSSLPFNWQKWHEGIRSRVRVKEKEQEQEQEEVNKCAPCAKTTPRRREGSSPLASSSSDDAQLEESFYPPFLFFPFL